MNRSRLQLIVLIATCACLSPARAAGVHKWVDEQGVTHYADEAPEAIETTLIDLPDAAAAGNGDNAGDDDSDFYSISNQWERMNRERLERERLELERARLRASRQTPTPTPTTIYLEDSDDSRYVPIYQGFKHRKHHGHLRHKRFYRGVHTRQQAPAQVDLGGYPTR